MTHYSSAAAAAAAQHLHLHHRRFRNGRPHYGLGRKRGVLSRMVVLVIMIMTRTCRRVSFGNNASPTCASCTLLLPLAGHHHHCHVPHPHSPSPAPRVKYILANILEPDPLLDYQLAASTADGRFSRRRGPFYVWALVCCCHTGWTQRACFLFVFGFAWVFGRRWW